MPRPRTPLPIAEATGAMEHNPGRYESRKNAPQPAGELGDPPNYFDDVHRDMWREIERTTAPGVLNSAHRFWVEITARYLVRFRSRDPEQALKPVEQGHMRACLSSMGLSPADQTRVTGSDVEKEQDPLDKLTGASSQVN